MNTPGSGIHPLDDLAAYAAGALHPHEHRTVDAHLATCQPCRAQLARYLETLAGLVPDEEPPPQVWARIRGAKATTTPAPPTPPIASDGDGSTSHPGRPGTSGTPPRLGAADDPHPAARSRRWLRSRPRSGARRRRPVRRTAVVGLAAAVLAVALAAGLVAFPTTRDDAPTPEELARNALDDSGSTVVTLDDPDTGAPAARMVVTSSGAAYVMLDRLDTLPRDLAYQLWRTEGTTPVSLGVLGPGTPDVVQVSLPTGTARIAISREPARGSPTPTGPLVAAATLHTGDPPGT